MLEETGKRGIKRLVGCEESRERKDALTSKLLNNYKKKSISIWIVNGGSAALLRPCENITLSTLPNADSATKTLRALSAVPPKTFLKNDAARIRPDDRISSFGTAATASVSESKSQAIAQLETHSMQY